MKSKFYPLIFIVMAGVALTSCKKKLLKEATVSLNVSATTVDISFPQEAHYIETYVGEEIILVASHQEKLRIRMKEANMDPVTSSESPDYTLILNALRFHEKDLGSDPRDDFHSLTIRADYTLLDANGQLLDQFSVESAGKDKKRRHQDQEGNWFYATSYTSLKKVHYSNIRSVIPEMMTRIRKDR